jgi:anaerobic magnesium-protoporphyrin IX monomethyl ester cyclase
MNKVVLCFPNNGVKARNVSISLPLSVLAVAASITERYDVAIYDERIQPFDMYSKLLEEQPLIVGVSAITGLQIRYGIRLAAEAKKRGIPVVWGGVHPSLLPEQTLESEVVDYVVAGEGEVAFPWLLQKLEKGEEVTNGVIRIPIEKLDNFPDLPYHLVDVENYIQTVKLPGHRMLPFLFSRGCPYRCGYCSSGYLGRKWKALSIDIALQRLDRLINRFQLSYVEFFDENITSCVETFESLARGIHSKVDWMMQTRLNTLLHLDLERLKSYGLDIVSSGLESGSKRILKMIRKRETIEEYVEANRRLVHTGIKAKYNMMMGFPRESLSDLYASVDLALKVLDENEYASFNPFRIFQPYPGTPLARQFNVNGYKKLEKWADFGLQNTDTPFVGEFKDILKKLIFSSKYVGRLFLNWFPGDESIQQLAEELRYKWKTKNFTSSDWGCLFERHQDIITRHFGEDAY